MHSKLTQLLDQVGRSEPDVKKMSDLSLLDEMLLSSVAGGDGAATLALGYNADDPQPNGQTPYLRYWADL